MARGARGTSDALALDVRSFTESSPSMPPTHVLVRSGDELVLDDLESGERVVLKPGVTVAIGSAVLFVKPAAESSLRLKSGHAKRAPPLCLADPVMKQLGELVTIVAHSEISVLLLGETGVGKEVVAHAIHDQSARRDGPFVAINCAALPEPLFESELFGHERGAFTGASTTKTGLLEIAHGGTLFLDEVGEMPLASQAKLLRAIERREIRRVGGTKPIPLDVRFIAATHRNLDGAIAEGRFRKDLYYRLNGFSLLVPPLRDRPASIRELAAQFLGEACARAHRRRPAIGPDALRRLQHHSWPGNVRELRNVMERAALVCKGEVLRPDHVLLDEASVTPPSPPLAPAAISTAHARQSLAVEIEELERRRILAALEEVAGNQTLAAKRLGISRRRLLDRLDEYRVPRPRKRH